MKKLILALAFVPFFANAGVYKCQNEETGHIEYRHSPCFGYSQEAPGNPDARFNLATDQRRVYLEGQLHRQQEEIEQLRRSIQRGGSVNNLPATAVGGDSYSKRLEMKNYERRVRGNMGGAYTSDDKRRNETAIQDAVNTRRAVDNGTPLYIDRRETNINIR